MSDSKVTLDTRNLRKLIKLLKSEGGRLRVGILGESAARNDTEEKSGEVDFSSNNAALGALHEFGGKTMPERSFLRMPMAEVFPKKLAETGIYDSGEIAEAVREGSFKGILNKLGVVAVACVVDAFKTGGYGKWAPVKNMKSKKNHQILVESGQLRDSITYDLKGSK